MKIENLMMYLVRGGGAGGGHGGGGFGGGGGHFGGGGGFGGAPIFIPSNGNYQNGGSSTFITLLIIGLILYVIYRRLNADVRDNPKMIRSPDDIAPQAPSSFALPNGESTEDLKNKARTAFLTVQRSWSEKQLAPMRRFISDGVFQRFNAQFTMMNLLKQTNPMSDVQVNGVTPLRYHRDGGYDCVDVRISAGASDQFICETFPNLNSPGGFENFSEIWTFIRRADYARAGDIFHSEQCPKCAAPLTGQLVATACCPYCGTLINSGEYDWVLAEITQEEDDPPQIHFDALRVGLPTTVDPRVSREVVEDKATNALMQILIGAATKNNAALKRFTTESLFNTLQAATPKAHLVFDRLYTSGVQLIGTKTEGDDVTAYVGIRYHYHEIDLDHADRAFRAADDPASKVCILALAHTMNNSAGHASVYAGTCPSCGALIKDSLLMQCPHCGSTYNDPKLDWIVTDRREFP